MGKGPDPYEVLGVERGASDEEIDEAYRENVLEYHPDTSDHEDAIERFKRVKRAYEQLEGSGRNGSDNPATGTAADGSTDRTDSGGRPHRNRGAGRGSDQRGEDGSASGGRRRRAGERRGAAGATSRGTGDRRREERDERFWAEGDFAPDGLQIEMVLDGDWYLGWKDVDDGREWVVFGEEETAPYVEGGIDAVYVDGEGTVRWEEVTYPTREAAESAFDAFKGRSTRASGDEESGGSTTNVGAGRTESYRHATKEERTTGASASGEARVRRELDELWLLYVRLTDDDEVLWAVSDEFQENYLNRYGEAQTEPFWFDDRSAAVGAYRQFLKETRSATTSSTDETGEDLGDGGDVRGDRDLGGSTTVLGWSGMSRSRFVTSVLLHIVITPIAKAVSILFRLPSGVLGAVRAVKGHFTTLDVVIGSVLLAVTFHYLGEVGVSPSSLASPGALVLGGIIGAVALTLWASFSKYW